jgi:hypothetical protein
VAARIAATGSPSRASTTSVAPNSRAYPRCRSSTSTATMRRAPSMCAAWMTFRPMPPQPITATSDPTSIRAVFMTAP